MIYLEKRSLATDTDRIDSVLVETSGRRDRRVVVDPLAAVDGPVVVAEVVDGPVTAVLIHQPVFALLLCERPVDTLLRKFGWKMSQF